MAFSRSKDRASPIHLSRHTALGSLKFYLEDFFLALLRFWLKAAAMACSLGWPAFIISLMLPETVALLVPFFSGINLSEFKKEKGLLPVFGGR